MKLMKTALLSLAALAMAACAHTDKSEKASTETPTSEVASQSDMSTDETTGWNSDETSDEVGGEVAAVDSSVSTGVDDTMNDDTVYDDTMNDDTLSDTASGTTSGTTSTTTTTETDETTASNDAAKVGTIKDGEASAIVNAANDAEIDAAKLAKQKAQSAEVKSYAEMMIKDHTANKKEQSKVMEQPGLNSKRNQMALDMRKNAQQKLKDLKGKSGAEFDKAYIESQVAMHSDLLTNLNEKLIPGAEKAEFRSFLESTRDHVKHHLEEAQKLQASMK